jgi:5-methylcytosine-specific restriction endonuclease McrA
VVERSTQGTLFWIHLLIKIIFYQEQILNLFGGNDMICDYGCNQKALYKTKSGKNCCSKSVNQCLEMRRKNSESVTRAFKEGRIKTGHNKGKSFKSNYKYTNDEAFSSKSTYSTLDLKKRLIKEKILEYKCSICNIVLWMNKPIPLDLDHINGNSMDNTIENLRFLCPNCHSQTETYRGKNINNGKKKVSDEDFLKALKEENSIRQALIKVGLAAKGSNYTRAKKLSAQLETTDVELLKVGEPLH